MKLFTLHHDIDIIKSALVADSAEEAATAWGGEFIPRENGPCTSSTDSRELGICGIVRFGSHLFREMESVDRYLAGCLPGNVVYVSGNLGILSFRGQPVDLLIKSTALYSVKS